MKIISGNSNLSLACEISRCLDIDLSPILIRRFADMEVFIEINETVRGEDIFLVQSTSCPTNDHIMELLICLDTLKRSSARRVTAVIPYYGYSRQDRKLGPRTPITAKLVANILTSAGADRILTLDLHSGQIQGFFDIPVDNLFSAPVFVEDIKEKFDLSNLLIISPDTGGIIRARDVAKRLGIAIAVVDKRRNNIGEPVVMNIIGDVQGRDCIIIDDIVDSASTLCNSARALIEKGANTVSAYITHGVLSDGSVDKVSNSALRKLVITDSIDVKSKVIGTKKIEILTIAPFISEAIRRISNEESVSNLFN